MNKEKNYYNILHADKTADDNQLKKCYRAACLIYHPDKGGTDLEFQLVNEAWQVLSDSGKRAAYDNVSGLCFLMRSFSVL